MSADPCSAEAIGIPGATKLALWTPPDGCTLKPSNGPVLVPDQAGFDAQLACTGGSRFGQPLVVTTLSFSPAQVGLMAFDDGKTVTLVSMQRDPCPNAPRPMPGPSVTMAFSGVSRDPRTFANRACTVTRACP